MSNVLKKAQETINYLTANQKFKNHNLISGFYKWKTAISQW